MAKKQSKKDWKRYIFVSSHHDDRAESVLGTCDGPTQQKALDRFMEMSGTYVKSLADGMDVLYGDIYAIEVKTGSYKPVRIPDRYTLEDEEEDEEEGYEG